MDKKKLARLMAVIGSILLVVTVALWFVPTMKYSYTEKVTQEDGTKVEQTFNKTMSPMGYFAEGAAVSGHFHAAYVVPKLGEDYNTNQDMYWLAFGLIFSIVSVIFARSHSRKLYPKIIATVCGAFVLCGVIMSPVLHLSFLWVAYLIVAILAFAAIVAGLVYDIITD